MTPFQGSLLVAKLQKYFVDNETSLIMTEFSSFVDTGGLSIVTFLCDMQKTKPKINNKNTVTLFAYIYYLHNIIWMFEQTISFFFCLLDSFSKKVLFISVLQYSLNNNGRHSEQSFGNTAMFIHKFFSGTLYLSHTKTTAV